jgi:hypothetical protein
MTAPRITWASRDGETIAVMTREDLAGLLRIAEEGELPNAGDIISVMYDGVLESVITEDGTVDDTMNDSAPAQVSGWQQRARRYAWILAGI